MVIILAPERLEINIKTFFMDEVIFFYMLTIVLKKYIEY